MGEIELEVNKSIALTSARRTSGESLSAVGSSSDLTCLGKVVIGGGLPMAAYSGAGEIMQHVAPAGTMYQAGTLSGNPLAMAAGIATLQELQTPGIYEQLSNTAEALASGFSTAAREVGVPLQATSVGSMGGFFSGGAVSDYATAKGADTSLYGRFVHSMLEQEVYLAPSQFEAAFVSTQHGSAEIEVTLLQAARISFQRLSA